MFERLNFALLFSAVALATSLATFYVSNIRITRNLQVSVVSAEAKLVSETPITYLVELQLQFTNYGNRDAAVVNAGTDFAMAPNHTWQKWPYRSPKDKPWQPIVVKPGEIRMAPIYVMVTLKDASSFAWKGGSWHGDEEGGWAEAGYLVIGVVARSTDDRGFDYISEFPASFLNFGPVVGSPAKPDNNYFAEAFPIGDAVHLLNLKVTDPFDMPETPRDYYPPFNKLKR